MAFVHNRLYITYWSAGQGIILYSFTLFDDSSEKNGSDKENNSRSIKGNDTAQEVAENSFRAALAAGAAQGFVSSSNCCGGAGNSFAVFGFGATRPLNLPGLCRSFR